MLYLLNYTLQPKYSEYKLNNVIRLHYLGQLKCINMKNEQIGGICFIFLFYIFNRQ